MPALPFCHVHLEAQKPETRPYPKELKTMGDHIRKRRLDLGLLQRQAAAQIGVTDSCIWNWESNTTEPELHCLPRSIQFLGSNPLPSPTSIVEKLVAFRTRRGIRQTVFAKLIGIDTSTLARWERGEREPTGRVLENVTRFLKTGQNET
jgi:DNA-binding transcriptional regulator YiaG